MLFLSYAYRFLSNFVFLALVYFALNFLDKYQHRVVVAILVLVYAGMHAASALRSFHFFQRIERLEGEARRLAQGGGLRLNDVQETNGDRLLTEDDVVGGVIKLSQGRKKIVLVRPV